MKYDELSFVKIGGFSSNLDSFLTKYILFHIFIFKNVWNTVDNIRKCKNGHLKWKVTQPSAAALGFKSLMC